MLGYQGDNAEEFKWQLFLRLYNEAVKHPESAPKPPPAPPMVAPKVTVNMDAVAEGLRELKEVATRSSGADLTPKCL